MWSVSVRLTTLVNLGVRRDRPKASHKARSVCKREKVEMGRGKKGAVEIYKHQSGRAVLPKKKLDLCTTKGTTQGDIK